MTVEVCDGCVRLGGKSLNISAGRRGVGRIEIVRPPPDMQVGPAARVRWTARCGMSELRPIQRAEVAGSGERGEDRDRDQAPRDRELQIGDVIGLPAPALPHFRQRRSSRPARWDKKAPQARR